jgi:predicted SprT family Zn-dependent metalloprotease
MYRLQRNWKTKKIRRAKMNFDKKLQNITTAEKEKLAAIENMALSLMLHYGISHYKLKFGYGWKYRGVCHYNKSIIISLNFALRAEIDDVKNTILHEIAHALVGPGIGHRNEWQLKAKELGVVFYKNYRN